MLLLLLDVLVAASMVALDSMSINSVASLSSADDDDDDDELEWDDEDELLLMFDFLDGSFLPVWTTFKLSRAA